ncbi:MAG: rhodoquinone biosynthesis methyltransferase RquA [Rhodospirillaceae bacterium]
MNETIRVQADMAASASLAEPLAPAATAQDQASAEVPSYLRDVYHWAYLDERWLRFLDRQAVVNAILWGNAQRLMQAAIQEVAPGHMVLQPACVYGRFSNMLAEQIGVDGRLAVRDIAPIQVHFTQQKCAGLEQVDVDRADAALVPDQRYDRVICFFLLHEVPDDYKAAIVQALLRAVKPGGKVVFVDYHRPHRLHPMRLPMFLVFRFLEPFAQGLCNVEIPNLSGDLKDKFNWKKETFFGGLYQKVVATTV